MLVLYLFLCSIAGSLGTHVVNNTGATMAMAPILGVGTIPSLGVATSLVSVPAFPGLGAAGVQVPTVAANLLGVGTPSECLLLKNMFDPTAEVYYIILKISVKFSVYVLPLIHYPLCSAVGTNF